MNIDSDENFNKAINIIIKTYLTYKNNDDELKDMFENEGNVITKWSKKFNLNNIDNITKNDFNFFNYTENHHWKNIHRYKNKINLDDFRNGLKILLNESKDIGERFKEAIGMVKYLKIATASPILLVSNPEKYGIWNNISQAALEKLNLWQKEWTDDYSAYKEINNLLLRLRDKVMKEIPGENFDLWILDGVLYKISDNKKLDGVLYKISDNKKEQWWIEKTKSNSHSIANKYGIGSALWSPQTSAGGKKIYQNMTKVKIGDKILHLVMDKGNLFTGVSKVISKAKIFKIPQGTKWTKIDSKNGYNIKLDGYKDIGAPKLTWDELKESKHEALKEIAETNSDLFYTKKDLRLNQGKYLTPAPEELIKLINDEYKKSYQNQQNQNLPYFQVEEEQKKIPNSNLKIKNIILHGPVGTGKTYFANTIAKKIIHDEIHSLDDIEKIINTSSESMDSNKEKEKRIVKITFHKSYSYEDFVIGIKAFTEKGQISYKVVPGIFKKLCDEANKQENKLNKYVLIIDEINRGDISRIFGELITLIEEDKRGEENKITLSYTKENSNEFDELIVPENLYIIGTMNDSDKSISLVDIALRRRFTFIYVGFNENVLGNWLEGIKEKENIITFIKEINEKISAYKGSVDFQIGHAFFRSLKEYNDLEKEKEVVNIFKNKIFPLLEEYFYNDMDVLIEKILNKKFYEKLPKSDEGLGYYYVLKETDKNKKDFNSIFLNELIKNESNSNDKKSNNGNLNNNEKPSEE